MHNTRHTHTPFGHCFRTTHHCIQHKNALSPPLSFLSEYFSVKNPSEHIKKTLSSKLNNVSEGKLHLVSNLQLLRSVVNASAGVVDGCVLAGLFIAVNHGNAVWDRADADTEGASCARIGDVGLVGFRVEFDRLVPGVVAGHHAFTAVDAKVVVDQSNSLVVRCHAEKVRERSDVLQGFSDEGLNVRDGAGSDGGRVDVELGGLRGSLLCVVVLPELSKARRHCLRLLAVQRRHLLLP